MDGSFDRYVTGDTPQKDWINAKFWRMEVFTPFFDDKTSWYPKGWVYKDIYAIYNEGSRTKHPEWILRDSQGQKLYIPWGKAADGTYPQFAADITNADFRANWISELKAALAKGYKGAWIDDVNLDMRVGRPGGSDASPYSPTLGRTMTADDWRKAMADFVEQIRREIPNHELLHNSIWYAARDAGREDNPEVQRQIAAADYINREGGFNDNGLTGGTGEWSLRSLYGFLDKVHSLGRGVIIDAFDSSPAGREYSLANYFISTWGRDGIGEMSAAPDASWWEGWDIDLGTETSGRYDWQGLIRRDFTGGIVLVNEPKAPTRTVTLSKAMTTIDGRSVTSITLEASRGAVLTG